MSTRICTFSQNKALLAVSCSGVSCGRAVLERVLLQKHRQCPVVRNRSVERVISFVLSTRWTCLSFKLDRLHPGSNTLDKKLHQYEGCLCVSAGWSGERGVKSSRLMEGLCGEPNKPWTVHNAVARARFLRVSEFGAGSQFLLCNGAR